MLRDLFGKGQSGPQRPRAAERFHTVGLRCPLGDVVDLSVTGVRIRFATNPGLEKGESVTISIQSESQSVKVAAKVAWIRRTGLRGGLIGLQFMNVRPGIAAALTQLGKYGFITADSNADTSLNSPGSGGAPPKESPSAKPQPPQAAIEIEDLYEMLGVSRTAGEAEIKKAYHTLALELHPDRNPSPEAASQFADAAKAYKVLRSPELRARYDDLLSRCPPPAKKAA